MELATHLAVLVLGTVAAALVVVALAALLVTTLASRRRLRAELQASRDDVTALQARVEDLARAVRVATSTPDDPGHAADPPAEGHDYLITSLPGGQTGTGERVTAATPTGRRVTGGEFASLAVGESLVRIVSVAYGVRRALSAESRNRIRFEIRREVKRSRRQRRRDVKEARRQARTGQPVGQRPDPAEDAA